MAPGMHTGFGLSTITQLIKLKKARRTLRLELKIFKAYSSLLFGLWICVILEGICILASQSFCFIYLGPTLQLFESALLLSLLMEHKKRNLRLIEH
jgi:hypothetical protein